MFLHTLKKHRKRLLLLLGVTLLAALIIASDTDKIVRTLLSLTLAQITMLVLLQLLTIFLINVQWTLLAKHLGRPLSFANALEMNFLGTFFESVTPVVKAGGEAYKFAYLKTKGESASEASALIGAQKTFSMLTFVALALFSLLLAGGLGLFDRGTFISLWFAFGALVLFMAFLYGLYRFMARKQTTAPSKPKRFVLNLKNSLAPLGRKKSRFFLYIPLGLAIWFVYALKTFYVLHSFSIDLSYPLAASVTYITYMVNMLPLSPGGLGTFEGTMSGLFVLLGVSAAVAIGATLALRLATFWLMLLLSAAYLLVKHFWRRKPL